MKPRFRILLMAKILLFDWWGTLVNNGTYSPLRQTYQLLRPRMKFGDFVHRFEDVFMTQRFETQEEAFHSVFDALNVRPKAFVMDKLIGIWNKNRLLGQEYEDTAQALAQLKTDYTLVLCTNAECFLETIFDKFDWMNLFDKKFLSYEAGELKQSGALITHAITELGAQPADVIYIGDSIETDIEGAQAAGIRAILVDRKGRREYDDKVANLLDLPGYLNE